MAALAAVALVHTLSIAGFSLALALLIHAVIEAEATSRVVELAVWLLGAVAVRALTHFVIDALAQRGGARVKSQLRGATLSHLRQLGPGYMTSRSSTEVTNLLSRGIDALDVYFGRYLPQLVLTAVQTPVLLVILWLTDIPTGIAITLALPIIPIFMVLIGWATQAVQKRQWESMQVLARGFIDIVEGLSTLKIFGRQWRQIEKIRDITSQFRRRTIAVLRVSFLSSFVLELAASLSVAIVAVSVGIRLINGDLPLWLGLFVLVLVPEIYIPLRAVGAQFHSAADGLSAAEDIFEVLETTPDDATGPVHSATGALATQGTLELVTFSPVRDGQAVTQPVDATMVPGTITVLEGPSGSGKSSVIDALMGFIPARGDLLWANEPVDARALRDLIAWTPQSPSLVAGSVAQNVALGQSVVDIEQVHTVLQAVGLDELSPDYELGAQGVGLSGGQAQRLSLARAIYRQITMSTPIVICDEVTSALDDASEDVVWRAIESLAASGCVVIVVSHRLRVNARADQTVSIQPAPVPSEVV